MPDLALVRSILYQVLEALEKIRWRFTPVKTLSDLTDTQAGMEKLDGICMLFIAIGESCKKIDRLTDGELLAQYPEVDWKGVKGLRDIISHHYFDVDAEEIFNICTDRMPLITETVRKILKEIK